VTVDAVVMTIVSEQLHVVLIRRDQGPFAGDWALPGGFKRPDETLDAAVARELREEAGLDAAGHLSQLGAYGDPDRDPRLNVVTVAYRAVLPTIGTLTADTDAREAKAWPVEDVLAGRITLAFDHERILRDAIDRTRIDLEATDLATAFVGPSFTLSQLRAVFEAVWAIELDPANFRRTLFPTGYAYVEATGEHSRPGPEGGRPPELYRTNRKAWSAGAPVRRLPAIRKVHPPRPT
jgi:8-oxo-dGTP diphosphatase